MERGRGRGLQTFATGVVLFDNRCLILMLTGGGQGGVFGVWLRLWKPGWSRE